MILSTRPSTPHPHRLFGRLLLLTVSLFTAAAPATGQQGPASVVVSDVINIDVAARQSFVGSALASRRVIVGSAVDGRVLEYPIEAGQEVTSGQTLAQLRTATIEIEIEGAKAELDLRMAELEELRNGSRPEELRLAEATVAAAAAMGDYARTRFARAESLLKGGSGISKDEFEEARAAALEADARLTEATNQLDLVRQGPRQEKIKQAAARVAVQEQVIAGLADRADKFTVRAPFDGFVVSEMTQSGAWLQQGMAVAEIVDIDPIEFEVYVPENNIGFARRGMEVVVQVDSFPGVEFAGKLTQIVPLADPRARTFPVKIQVANPRKDGQHKLLPGMLARVRLPTSGSRRSLMVPKDALQLGGPQPIVMKVDDGKAVSVEVAVGASLESVIAITPLENGLLSEGDLVVIRGNERLRNGQPVAIVGERKTEVPEKVGSASR